MRLKNKKTGEILDTELNVQEAMDVILGHNSLTELTEEWEDVSEEKTYGGRVPEEGDCYWYITEEGEIEFTFWGRIFNGANTDRDRFKSGNAFWSEKEADKELKRRKAYVVLKEDTKGFEPNWRNGGEKKCIVYYDYIREKLETNSWIATRDTILYFRTKEDAIKSIEKHGQMWLDFFGIEEDKNDKEK